MPSITNVYESHWRARKVVSELEAAGIPSSNISMLFHKYVSDKPGSGEEASATATGTGVGAVVGGGAGLLAGIGLLVIPGLGPIVAAGWWAPTITGVLAGGATGGIVGALVESGVSEDHAHVLSEAVRRYGTLVSVRFDSSQATTVRSILDRHEPADPDRLGKEYGQTGWKRFDPAGAPFELSEEELERRRGLR